MLKPSGETMHASAVLVGERAVLIHGASGSGKSRLAWALVKAGRAGLLPSVRLVADDRVRVFAAGGRLLAAAPATIHGMIEVRGLGIRRVEYEPLALVGLLVELGAADGARLPETNTTEAKILGIGIPRLPVATGTDAYPLVFARFSTGSVV